MFDDRRRCIAAMLALAITAGAGQAVAQQRGADSSTEATEAVSEAASGSGDEVAAEETSQFYEQVEVRARADDLVGVARSAAEGATSHEDLATRPLLRPAELVETVPGVIATQHSGDGKANQYFLRGSTSTTAPTSASGWMARR